MMYSSYEYLLTTIGALKIVHVVFGVLSIGLFSNSFVPVTQEIVFVSIVTTILAVSLVYLLAHLAWPSLTRSKINGRIDFVYHIVAGLCLISVGIDLLALSWEDYFEICDENCPSLYTKGVAKIFTFINGVLYGIVAFLNAKEETLIKSEELTDSDLEDLDIEQLPLVIKVHRVKRYTYENINNN